MKGSKGPAMDLLWLELSLVQFLEASATSCQDAGPKYEASWKMLCNCLQMLKNTFELHWEVFGALDELLQKPKNTMTEEAINVAVVDHILRHLTVSCFM